MRVSQYQLQRLLHLLRRKPLLGIIAVIALCSAVLMPKEHDNNHDVQSFSSAKRLLPRIYQQLDNEFGNTSTIYCGCDISYKNNGKNAIWSIDVDRCGFKSRNKNERTNRIEVEHVMPASEFGSNLLCWKMGGRQKCSSNNDFKQMEGDMHNLYPAIGEINGDRGNLKFSEWNAKPTVYGKCKMVIDFEGNRVQPPVEARGQIARAYLYMANKYNIRISDQQKKLYLAWDKKYPATAMDCRRNELINKEQGNDNPYVTESCRLAKAK